MEVVKVKEGKEAVLLSVSSFSSNFFPQHFLTFFVKVKEGKEAVPTREPDLKMELKRGSMRDKWGLTLVHRMGEGGRIELGVSKVGLPCCFLKI